MRMLRGCLFSQHYYCHVILFIQLFHTITVGYCSDVSIEVGSGAASQLLREGIHQLLRRPNSAQLSIQTSANPLLPSLAKIEAENRIFVENISFVFEPKLIRLNANNVRIRSVSTVTPNLWPMSFSDEIIHLIVNMGDVELITLVDDMKFSTEVCSFQNTDVEAYSSHYWLVDSLLSVATIPLQNSLEYLLCPILSDYATSLQTATISKVSLWQILPSSYREILNNSDAWLYYRIRTVDIQQRHARLTAQLEWNIDQMKESDLHTNGSLLNILWDSDERIAFMIDDTAVNELLNQIDWNFQWMEEQIGVSSPVLPTSSRDFLSTLCTSCYFLLHVWANGPPVIHATNGSIILEKQDRINMRVVNPERNATSVFVSMTLSINAELRPVVDSGTIRTLVQLLDTKVVMKEGAFPPTYTSFVEDLVRSMILDVMWPEMKKKIEDLTYGHGINLASSCGVDLNTAEILIDEGQFGATVSLVLSKLKPEQCLKELQASLPKASNLFPQ